MIRVFEWICVGVLLPLSLVVLYQWILAVVSILPWRPRQTTPRDKNVRFIILIPAHNEQYTLSHTLESIRELRYPKEGTRVVVLADRCSDATAVVARKHGVQCLERSNGLPGKGAAIAWAIGELKRNSTNFDALVIIDADTIVDPGLLEAFAEGLASGHRVQQAYNSIANPWETPFTRIIAVTSVLRNEFFYKGKSRLGLSGMLMGTGMCFSRPVVEQHGWTALSVGEDWEFSVSLLLRGEKIYFKQTARVRARESRGFHQASTQRLRWASGRHAVAFSGAPKLFWAGLRLRRLYLADAALTLLAPNYSTQATLAIFALIAASSLSQVSEWYFLLTWATLLMGSLTTLFLVGVAWTDAPLRALGGIMLIPVFLPWRMAIEVLGFLGYGRKRWVRTTRIVTPRRETDQ